MDQYIVTGMSCAACQARVEKAVSKVSGVESVSVSLLTNSMGVVGTAAPEAIIHAVLYAGYGAKPKGNSKDPQNTQVLNQAPDGKAGERPGVSKATSSGAQSLYEQEEEMLKDHETPVLKKRLI